MKVTHSYLAPLSLFAVTAVWGLTFTMVRTALESIDVYYFLFLRFSIASIAMIFLFPRQVIKIDKGTMKDGIILGLSLLCVYIAQTEGLRLTTASNSALITGLYVVVIPIIAYLGFKEKPPIGSTVGVALALPGTYLLTNYSLKGAGIGDFVTLIVPFAAAAHTILTGVYTKRRPLVGLVIVQFILIASLCGIICTAKGGVFVDISAQTRLTLFVTAILASVLAFMTITWAQRTVDPTRAGIILALEAPFAVVFAYLLGGEMLSGLSLVGACLMVAGMFISEFHLIVKKITEQFL